MMDKWTLLLTGEQNGLVGEIGSKFHSSPKNYERVDVIRISEYARFALKHEREIAELKERIRGYQASNELLKAQIEKWKQRYKSRMTYEQSMETYDLWDKEAGNA